MGNSQAINLAALLARRFEGFYSAPYLCPAGVPTIGYGATHYEDWTSITLLDPPITRERAEALLEWELLTTQQRVSRACPGADTDGREAAMIDFAFNLGIGRLRASTLRRRVNAGQWEAAAAELLKWTRAGGRVLPGLLARRTAEAAML